MSLIARLRTPAALAFTTLALVCGTSPAAPTAKDDHSVTAWEPIIQRFERRDRRRPPRAGSVVFVGSSSVRLWKTLADDMAPVPVINRGFGGARTDDVLHYADRIVLPYRPRAIVYYAGDNDLGRDRAPTPASVAENFQEFVSAVEQSGQVVPVYFVSIKPSPKRMKRWARMRAANERIEEFASEHPLVTYLDVATPMLTRDGGVRRDLFSPDGVHMNARGYALWTSIVRPALETQVGPNPLYL